MLSSLSKSVRRSPALRRVYKRTVHAAGNATTPFVFLRHAAAHGMSSLRRLRAFDEPPVLIGGCERSGTTLLLSILSCHPGLLAIPTETGAFCPDAYSRDPDHTIAFRRDVLLRTLLDRQPSPARRWVEKTPANVFTFNRAIRYFDGQVRCINIVRDGRDVAISIHPRHPGRPFVSPERWVNAVRTGRRNEAFPQVLSVRYEDLIFDYDRTLRRICDHIGVAYVKDFAGYPEAARVSDHGAWARGAAPLNIDSIGRWRAECHQAAVARLLETPGAQELLRYYGYL